MQELAKTTVTSEDDVKDCLEGIPLDGANVRRRNIRSIKFFSEWIENEPNEKWALLYDEDGARCGTGITGYHDVSCFQPSQARIRRGCRSRRGVSNTVRLDQSWKHVS